MSDQVLVVGTKQHPRLIALLRETMNLTTGEAEALIKGRLSEAVMRCGGREKTLERALRLKHYLSDSRVRRKYPGAVDKTFYALDCGYTGRHRVYVLDGLVVSHGKQHWHSFITRVTEGAHKAA